MVVGAKLTYVLPEEAPADFPACFDGLLQQRFQRAGFGRVPVRRMTTQASDLVGSFTREEDPLHCVG
jgi:hypothetical protein